MAMKNPPRRTTIKGQPHLLAYITPEEADVLKAMGGSGEKVHGIPAFYGGPDAGRSQGGFGGRGRDYGDGPPGGGFSSKTTDPGPSKAAKDAAEKARQEAAAMARPDIAQQRQTSAAESAKLGMSPGAYGGLIGSAYQTAPAVGRGFDVNLAKAMSRIAAAPASQRLGFTDRQIMKAYQSGTQPGIMGMLGVPLGRTQNYLTFNDPRKGIYSSFDSQAAPLGALGFVSELFDLDPYVTTGFNQDGTLGEGRDGDGPETVPAEYNPVTGQQNQCPEGYIFDEDLQACRMGGGTPSFGQPVSGAGPYPAGDYARMGLLDVAPMGMGMFADRYGAGFGTPQDFSTANLAFRRGAATRPQYFQQAPDLTGYTLLS